MTINITGGRSMYRKAPTVEFSPVDNENRPFLTVTKAEINTLDHNDSFTVRSRHKTGCDIEHDAAFIFHAEGHGLKYQRMSGQRVIFTGVLFTVRHYPEGFEIVEGADLKPFHLRDDVRDEIEMCNGGEWCREGEPHLTMPYLPPFTDFKPTPVSIEVDFG